MHRFKERGTGPHRKGASTLFYEKRSVFIQPTRGLLHNLNETGIRLQGGEERLAGNFQDEIKLAKTISVQSSNENT